MKRLVLLFAVALAGALVGYLLYVLLANTWFWHPLGNCPGSHAEVIRCKSYNFHSGVGANGSYLFAIFGGLGAAWGFYKHRQCNVELPKNCRRWGHHVPGTTEWACPEHHPHGQGKGTGRTAETILKHHEDSGA